MNRIKRFFLWLVLLAFVAMAGLSAAFWYWSIKPVQLSAERIDFQVELGTRPRTVAVAMQKAGIAMNADAFVALARLTGRDTLIKAGAYEAVRGDTPAMLLERMANGDMTQTSQILVEGWTYQRIRQVLRENTHIKQTLGDVSDAQLLERLGSSETSPEGLFYPDTYVFVPGTSDFDILRRAYQAQQKLLVALWEQRAPDLPIATPYQALILASIIEKETGHNADRERVAGVFVNRLRLGMPLQTDPTVIYGMGDAYQGRIRKKDLTTDTPWNTYMRGGLPPTPIASSGKAALYAALHPEQHKFLYFVSRGDGTSEFSENLGSHNRAVSKYILGQGR
ncbi:endolytic transglycosylase MltG [Eoetvoesiella caeni]